MFRQDWPRPTEPRDPAVDQAIADLAEIYAYPDSTRPWVRANMVASVDGAVTVAGRSGGLSGPADRLMFSILRSLADVVLVGAGTARAERYGKAKPGEVWPQLRAGRAATPPIAVLSGRLDLDLTSRLFAPANPAGETDELPATIVLTTSAAPREQLAAAAKVAQVIEIDSGVGGYRPADAAVGAIAALDALGYRRILVEGGPGLLGQLVAADLLDDLCLTISPLLEDGNAGRITKAPAQPAAEPDDLVLASVLEDEGMLLCRYLSGSSAV